MSEQNKKAAERRQYLRCLFQSTAYVYGAENQLIPVHTLDISEGGLCIVTSTNPKPQSEFTIKIQLPASNKRVFSFDANVKVTHSVYSGDDNGFKIGALFTKIDPQAKEIVKQFVSARVKL